MGGSQGGRYFEFPHCLAKASATRQKGVLGSDGGRRMSFRVTARTILHLGSELISSDGVAFYELIKNSLDARSPEIRVDVVVRIDFDTYDAILRELGERRDPAAALSQKTRSWQELRDFALSKIDREAVDAEQLREEI